MNSKVRPYNPSEDLEKVLQIIKSEGEEWEDYLTPEYEGLLETSVTYVALLEGVLCGYARSLRDGGFFVWVMDLLVDRNSRGHGMGKQMLERIAADFPNQEVYVLSDVDAYYEKLGYQRAGSLYQVG